MNRQAATVAASLRNAFVVVAAMLVAACATTDSSVDDVWIQINASFLRDIDAARPLIAAAINATRTN